MNKKIFFFDVDGTLVKKNTKVIFHSAITAINKLQDLGHKVVICTGRDISAISAFKLNDKIKWDGYICANGQMIYDANLNLVTSLLISSQDVHLISERLKAKNIDYFLVCDGYTLAPYYSDYLKAGIEYVGQTAIMREGGYNAFKDSVQMMCCYPLEASKFDNSIIKGTNTKSSFAKFGQYNLVDINVLNINKAIGAQKFKESMGYNELECVSFGDGSNDIELLETSDLAIAMGECADELLAVCDYQTAMVEYDGIYNALVHFGFIS
ncbi:MAG: Cof-type HAD-IIB family hydrolase [Erysipelotrichaceae bacterium]